MTCYQWPDPARCERERAAVDHYVDIRSTLEEAGNLISQPDLWIAAITRAVLESDCCEQLSRS